MHAYLIILMKKALLLEINLLMLVKNSGQNINWDKRVLKSQLSFIYLKIRLKKFL